MNATTIGKSASLAHGCDSSHASRRRVTAAGIAGNVMEWYDFAVYGYFAPIIGRQFFPSDDPTASLLAAFGVFAAGFLMRPVGGLIFGYVGDRHGRKAALTASVLAMAIPTFLIGILPTHAAWGAWASASLVALRMIQGISVGGEYTTSVVFLVESAKPEHRGLAGSWSTVGATLGTLMGSAVGALVSNLFAREFIETWGWRLPFLLGLVVGMSGLYIRRHLAEPAEPEKEKSEAGGPIGEALRHHWRSMVAIAALNVLNAVGFYTAFVYLATYFDKVSHLSTRTALDINTLNMLVLVAVLPLAGSLSDRFGRKKLLLGAATAAVLFAWPLFWLMSHPAPVLAMLGQAGFALIVGTYCGVIPVTMVEAFPARVRCSAVSIGYNLCLGILGGTSPLVATWLIDRTHDDLSPAFYVMAAALVSLVIGVRLPSRNVGQSR